MLAESEYKDLHKRAFDMTYAWTLWDHLHAITIRGRDIKGLTEGYIAEHVSVFPENACRMAFTDSHDKNSNKVVTVATFSIVNFLAYLQKVKYRVLCLIGALGCLLAILLSSYDQLMARPAPLLTILGLILLVFIGRSYILKRINSYL